MEVYRKQDKKIVLEAGDVIEWSGCSDKVIAVVSHITKDDIVHAISICDGRTSLAGDKSYPQVHFVQFTRNDSIRLLLKGSETVEKFDDIELLINAGE